jgi:hypothetical protein
MPVDVTRVLGSLLFLLYMTDLPQIINNISTLILFADDTTILFTHSNTSKFNSNTLSLKRLISLN